MAVTGKTYKDLPPYSTVYWHYKQWRAAGSIEKLMTLLHEATREQVKKRKKWTTLMIVDSQAVKNTCNASVESKAFAYTRQPMGLKAPSR
jgi:hypothetical protein